MSSRPELNYNRHVLYQNDEFEIVDCEWNGKSISPMHGHGTSQCYFYVQKGTFEHKLSLGLKTEYEIYEEGQSAFICVGAKHEIKCISDSGRSVHIYFPRIKEMATSEILPKTIFAPKTLAEDTVQLKNEPTRFSELLNIMKQIQENSISTFSPYFMNQLFSGILPESIVAERLLAQTRTTLTVNETSPIFSQIEKEVIKSLSELIGWDKFESDGLCVTDESASNFMAVHVARQKKFPLAKEEGIQNNNIKIFISEDAHYSFEKACLVLGIGLKNLVKIKTNKLGQMDVDSLELNILQCVKTNQIPLMVCATAGTTTYGAFDSIEKIAPICAKYNCWLHVDAAWGGAALFSENLRLNIKDIHQADSVSFNGHNVFAASLNSSFFLTKHPNILLEANDVSGGEYLFHNNPAEIDLGRKSWQCSKKPDSFPFWTIWKSIGTQGLGNFVDKLLSVRNQTLEWIKNIDRIQLVQEPQYLNLCLKISPPHSQPQNEHWSTQVYTELKSQNIAFVNYSSNAEGSFLRFVFVNPHIELFHIQEILTKALDVQK